VSESLASLLDPQSITIIGATNNPGRIGGMPLDMMSHFGFKGHVYPVNPKYTEMFGYSCYPDVESLPATPELAVLAIAANEVTPMLKRCHARGIQAAIVFAAGFAEAGDEGLALQQELEAFAQASGMIIAGPNCMGFANLNSHSYTAFASIFKMVAPQIGRGSTAVLTQSGNVCSALFGLGRERGVQFSHFINTGNEACVEYSQYLNYLANDPDTDSVLGYIEQLRDGPGFIQAASQFAQQAKPLILYKAGETDKGSEAVQSHTSALAGNMAVYRSAFAQMNVIASNDFAQMVNLAYLAKFKHRQGGKRVAIVTMSGAMGAILADKCILSGLEVPTLGAQEQAALRVGIPDYGMVSNPVDVTGNIVNTPEFARSALTTLATSSNIDVLVVTAPGYLLDRMSEYLIEVASTTSRLIVAIDTGKATCREKLTQSGVAVFDDVGRAIQALGPFCQWLERREETLRWFHLHQKVQQATSSPRTLNQKLNEYETRNLLSEFGLSELNERTASNPEDAAMAANEIGYPVAVKILSADVPHKTELNAIRLNLQTAQAVKDATADILACVKQAEPDAKIEGVLIQPMKKGLAEIIIGITTDPVFGPVMTVGLGGILTEIYRDVAHRLLPVDQATAQNMLEELKAYPLLNGYRGRPIADQPAILQTMQALSQAFETFTNIQELEINPLLVHEAGHGASAIDALLLLKDKK
jgi:acyl-CoA synthetase (NDP forming)